MHENEIAKIVVDCCFQLHKQLGPGLYESVYEELLAFELKGRHLTSERQTQIPLVYAGQVFETAFRADIIVDKMVIIEIKSVAELLPVYYKQLLTYLRLTNIKLGLLVNFNENFIKDGIHRIVNGL